jgi:hypothetical protein
VGAANRPAVVCGTSAAPPDRGLGRRRLRRVRCAGPGARGPAEPDAGNGAAVAGPGSRRARAGTAGRAVGPLRPSDAAPRGLTAPAARLARSDAEGLLSRWALRKAKLEKNWRRRGQWRPVRCVAGRRPNVQRPVERCSRRRRTAAWTSSRATPPTTGPREAGSSPPRPVTDVTSHPERDTAAKAIPGRIHRDFCGLLADSRSAGAADVTPSVGYSVSRISTLPGPA